MAKSVIDTFNQCINVSPAVRVNLANNVYASRYLGLFMTLIHEFNNEYRVVNTQYFLEDVAAHYAHSDINDEQGIRNGLLSLFDYYLTDRRIIDFDLKSPFFEMVNHYYTEHLGGQFNPARYRNYVNGYLLTDIIKSDEDVEPAINHSIFHDTVSCREIDDDQLVMN